LDDNRQVNLADVCEHVAELTRPVLKKGVRFELDLSPEVPIIRYYNIYIYIYIYISTSSDTRRDQERI
jgi:hypothetical protein